MSDRPTPETDAVVRNAATADHPPTRLAATLTVKCEKLERERDEAREKYFALRDLSNNATELAEKYKQERDEARREVDRYREEKDLSPMSWDT